MLLLPPHFTGSVEQRKKGNLLGGFETGRSFQMQCRGRGWKEGFAGARDTEPRKLPTPHRERLCAPRP